MSFAGVIAGSRRRNASYERAFTLSGGHWYPFTSSAALGVWNDYSAQTITMTNPTYQTGAADGLPLEGGSNPFIYVGGNFNPNGGGKFIRNDQGYFTFTTEEKDFINAEEGALFVSAYIGCGQLGGSPRGGPGFVWYDDNNYVMGEAYTPVHRVDAWWNVREYLRIPPGTTKFKPAWFAAPNGLNSTAGTRVGFAGMEEIKFTRVQAPNWQGPLSGFVGSGWTGFSDQDNPGTGVVQAYNGNGIRVTGNRWVYKNRSTIGIPAMLDAGTDTNEPRHFHMKATVQIMNRTAAEVYALGFMTQFDTAWQVNKNFEVFFGGNETWVTGPQNPDWAVPGASPVVGQCGNGTIQDVYMYHLNWLPYTDNSGDREEWGGAATAPISRMFVIADDDSGASGDIRIWDLHYVNNETIVPV